MSREYAELGRLSGGHTGFVTAIAFSPQARYLATAATDNKICIWEVASRKLLHEYSGSNFALCFTWIPIQENHLLCGMSDGYVISLSFSQRNVRARGFVLHSSAIEAIAVSGVRVASGSRREVRVWDWNAEGPWVLHHEIAEPPTSSQEEDVSIAYLQWITIRPARLVVVYVDHGLRIFNARNWQCLLTRLDDKPVVRADLCQGDRLAIANPLSGFSIYSLKSGDLVRAFGQEVGQKRAPAVKFIESDKAIVGGSTVGEVNIWDIETGRKIQTLSHAGHRLILSLDARYDCSQGQHLIATAPCEEHVTTIFIWSKRALNASSTGGTHLSKATETWTIAAFIMGMVIAMTFSMLQSYSQAPGTLTSNRVDLTLRDAPQSV